MKFAINYISDLKVGDEILVGRFKDKRVTIKSFGVDEKGLPIIKTSGGTYKVFTFRVGTREKESKKTAKV